MELKKILGAIILAGFIALASGFVADILYSPKINSEDRGYSIAITEQAAPTATSSASSDISTTPAPKESAMVDLATLLKTADIVSGKKLSKKCAACHDLKPGGKNKVGPALFGIVGQPIAAKSDFKFSTAMSNKGGNWTNENLNEFIAKPKNFIKGTKMAFAGIKKPEKRADLIAYLNTLK